MQADIICLGCKNFSLPKKLKCIAFPKGIRDEVISGESDHSKSLPKQGNDIVFEPIKD